MAVGRIQLFSVPVADQDRAKSFYVDTLGFEDAPWGRFATFRDPDGNGFILQTPPPAHG